MKKKELEAKIAKLERAVEFLSAGNKDVTISHKMGYHFPHYFINYFFEGELREVEINTLSYPLIIKSTDYKIIFRAGCYVYELNKCSEKYFDISDYYEGKTEENTQPTAEPTEEKCDCKCKKGGKK